MTPAQLATLKAAGDARIQTTAPAIGDYSTEDMPFFEQAAKAGFPCYVDHDASKRIWHCGNLNYVWDHDYTALAGSHGIAKNEDTPKA